MGYDSIEAAVIEYVTQDVVEAPDRWSKGAEEVDVHVMLDSHWHREMNYQKTACGLRIPAAGAWRRAKKYDASHAEYCPRCFLEDEIIEALAVARVDQEIADEERAAHERGDWRGKQARTSTLGSLVEAGQRRTDRLEAVKLRIVTERTEMQPLKKEKP